MVDTVSPAKAGRPREFDSDAVIGALVELFWEQGFAATSIGDVVARTGLSTSSLYGAFGSKDRLYAMAVDRYLAGFDALVRTVLHDGERGVDDVDTFFDRMREQVEITEDRRGCLAVNTGIERGSRDSVLAGFGERHRDILRTGFVAALMRAAAAGEFERDRIGDTANLLVTAVLGLSVMIRSGAPLDEIDMHIDAATSIVRGN